LRLVGIAASIAIALTGCHETQRVVHRDADVEIIDPSGECWGEIRPSDYRAVGRVAAEYPALRQMIRAALQHENHIDPCEYGEILNARDRIDAEMAKRQLLRGVR
jgi:hypothetical protein